MKYLLIIFIPENFSHSTNRNTFISNQTCVGTIHRKKENFSTSPTAHFDNEASSQKVSRTVNYSNTYWKVLISFNENVVNTSDRKETRIYNMLARILPQFPGIFELIRGKNGLQTLESWSRFRNKLKLAKRSKQNNVWIRSESWIVEC